VLEIRQLEVLAMKMKKIEKAMLILRKTWESFNWDLSWAMKETLKESWSQTFPKTGLTLFQSYLSIWLKQTRLLWFQLNDENNNKTHSKPKPLNTYFIKYNKS
jgi:hypothetical protein